MYLQSTHYILEGTLEQNNKLVSNKLSADDGGKFNTHRPSEVGPLLPCDSSCRNAATTAVLSTTLTGTQRMEIRDLLWANSTGLLRIHRENINHVLDLQASLIRDILPSVVDEFGLGPDATEWATEWLNDTGTTFLWF